MAAPAPVLIAWPVIFQFQPRRTSILRRNARKLESVLHLKVFHVLLWFWSCAKNSLNWFSFTLELTSSGFLLVERLRTIRICPRSTEVLSFHPWCPIRAASPCWRWYSGWISILWGQLFWLWRWNQQSIGWGHSWCRIGWGLSGMKILA